MLVKQKLIGVFEKIWKTCLQNKIVYLGSPSKHDYFHRFLILPVKMVELPKIRELHLKMAEFLIHHAWKLVRFCVKPVFFLIISKCATFIESSFVFLCYFLLSSLLEGCYHYLVFMDPVNCYSKLQLLLKEQVSLKSEITFGYVCLF